MEQGSSQFQTRLSQIREQAHDESTGGHQFFRETLDLARAAHDGTIFVAAVMEYALAVAQQDYLSKNIDIVFEALQLAQSYHFYYEEAHLCIVIGRAAYGHADYQQAIQTWTHALKVAEIAKQDAIWIRVKVCLAQVYDALGDHANAVVLLGQASDRCQYVSNDALLLDVNLNLGVNLFKVKKYRYLMQQ